MSVKECNSCKQEIKETAEKCHLCGTIQENAGLVNKISIYIGTIIAVVSLTVMGIEATKKLLDNESAILIASVSDINYEKFNLVVSNIGSRPGVIYNLTIKYPPSIDCSSGNVWTMHRIDFENKVVAPGKTYSFSNEVNGLYKAFSGFNPEALSDKELMNNLEKFKVCSAKLTYLDFDGSHKSLDVSFHCGPQGECPTNSNKKIKPTQKDARLI